MHRMGLGLISRSRLRLALAFVVGILSMLTLLSCSSSIPPRTTSRTPPGTSLDTPAPSDPTLYATAVSEDSRQGTETTSISALSARTGTLHWHTTAPGSPGGPLAVSGGVVYAVTTVTTQSTASSPFAYTGHLFALDATTGHVLWQQDTPNPGLSLLGATAQLVLTKQSAPPGTTYERARTVIARNPRNGAELWQRTYFMDQSGYPYPSVAPIALTERALYLALTAPGASPSDALYILIALDPRDGSPLWQIPFSPGVSVATSNAVFADGTLYVARGDSTSTSVSRYTWTVMAFDAHDGSRMWASTPMSGDYFLVLEAAARGRLYVFNTTRLIALDTRSGAPVWSTPTDTGFLFSGDQALDANAIYYCSARIRGNGYIVGLSATDSVIAVGAADGTQRWKTPVDGLLSAPTVSQGTVYVGLSTRTSQGIPDTTHGYIEAFNASDGSLTWKAATDGNVTQPPTVIF